MGIDLGGVQVLVSQHLLKRPYIHAVLQHQSGSGVPELMTGIEGCVQPRLFQPLLDHVMYRVGRHARVPPGEEEGVGVCLGAGVPLLQPIIQCCPAGWIEEQDPLLIAFAQHTELVLTNIGHVQGDQLGDTQAAIQKEHEDAVVPSTIGLVHMFQ